LDEVKQQVSLIRNLPPDIEKPEVRLRQWFEMVAMVLVKGPEALDSLVPLARSIEKDLMRRGIDRITFEGLPASEIAIEVDSLKLFEMNISLDQLAQQLRQLSRDVPAGVIGEGQVSRQLRSLEQQRSSIGFAQMPIATAKNGQLIRLGDIATVTRRPRHNQVELEYQGHPAIMMELERATNSDAIDLAEIIHKWHREITPTLGPGVEVQIFLQAWRFLEDNIRIIIENGLMGLILVITSLFLFLNGRVGLWVMIGIPVTFMASLAMFELMGGTLNALSMIAMVMGLGIIVDDAIVVGEDSLTHYQNGKSPEAAAVAGARRMFPPVMASSLTTLAAFLPLVIMNDKFIKEIPIVMFCIIIASLIECFLVLPGHLRRAFEGLQEKEPSRFRQAIDQRFNQFRDNQFRKILRLSIDNRRTVLTGAFVLFAFGITLLGTGHLKLDMDVNVDFEMIEVGVQFTNGTTEEEKDRFVAHLEKTLEATEQTLGNDNIMGYVVVRNFAFLSRERKYGPDYARMMVEYALPHERSTELDSFINIWRENVQKSAAVEELQILSGQDYGSDISLVLRGDNLDTLKTASEELSQILAEYDGVLTVYDDLPYGREQWIIHLTTEGRAAGLTTAEIGRQLRAAYDGERVQIFNEGDEELEVRVMLPYQERSSLASLSQLPIRTAQGQVLPLSAVAAVENRRGIDVIRHHNGYLAVTVNADMDTSVNTPLSVIGHIQENGLKDVINKYGVEFGLGGRSAEEAKRLGDLSTGALVALALIYIILAWIFASYTWPLAVMIAIPLGATGALVGHWLIGMNLGIIHWPLRERLFRHTTH
ncbi:MAG: efflux RND transporter permease subunit, partial [Pseudomonadota bacterium]